MLSKPTLRFVLSLLAIGLVTSCDSRPKAATTKVPTGVWLCEFTYLEGGDFKSTVTITPSGSYSCEIRLQHGTNTARIEKLEGHMQIKDDLLIDVLIKSSNTNFTRPITNEARIVRMGGDELVVRYQGQDKDSVFRRIE